MLAMAVFALATNWVKDDRVYVVVLDGKMGSVRGSGKYCRSCRWWFIAPWEPYVSVSNILYRKQDYIVSILFYESFF